MLETLGTYVVTVLVMMGLDGLWLGVIVKDFNLRHLGSILAPNITWWPVFLFYPLYAIGVMVFVIMPSLQAHSLAMTLWRGALLGLIAYSAYDLTNNATIAHWPVLITLTDMAWGAVCTTLTSAIVYLIMK